MKTTLATATLAAIGAATALAGYLQHVPGDVADSRQNFPLRVARGEIVDLSIDFFNDGEPLDITGADVTLHTCTNGMDAAESWQTVGTATNNSALFVFNVDAVLPLAAGQWSCVVSRDGRTLARVGGPAYVRGTAAGTVASDPVSALSGYATTGYVAQAVAAIDVTESDPVWETEKDGYARAGDLGSAAFVDTLRKYALDATNAVGITIQPLTTSDWQANYIGGFVISHPDYGSASLLFPDDFTETESGWYGQIDFKRVAPFVPLPRRYGGVLITNLVFGAETPTMTSSAVECSMDCFADWQGDSDNIHFAFYARSNLHDGWMSVGEAADLAASSAAVAATNHANEAVAALKSQVETGWWGERWTCSPTHYLGHELQVVPSEVAGWWEVSADGLDLWSDPVWGGSTAEWRAQVDWGGDTNVVATRHRFAGPTEDFSSREDMASVAQSATNYTDSAIAAFAATNPPPDLSGYATAPGVTNIVKSLSLGGIWDEQIQVWWTPRMRNGSLTYEATTNVNLNAEN